MTGRLLIAICLVLAGVGGYIWRNRGTSAPQQTAAPAQAPAEVGVTTVQSAELPIALTYAGRIAGYRDVEIRAQVSGILIERAYEDGAKVTTGQALFRIDRHDDRTPSHRIRMLVCGNRCQPCATWTIREGASTIQIQVQENEQRERVAGSSPPHP